MSSFQSRQAILVFIASAVAVGSLLAPESALAEQPESALFRIEQRWHNSPNPAVTPGGAGMYQGYIYPYYVDAKWGFYFHPPATAMVAPGNPIGGAFTLPQGFLTSYTTCSFCPDRPGYQTTTFVDYYNGPGKFGPNHGSTASNVRVVFPTTNGEPVSDLHLNLSKVDQRQ